MKITTMKPRGTVSILNGQSTGVHPRSAMMRNYVPPKYSKITEAVVDGAIWYTVSIDPEVMMWFRGPDQWKHHPENRSG